jgi:hypothetical protein|tara:strand:- start:18133 stop:18399 length:267 start_codon:yes stop_codon:yes gene_type:complete
MSRTLNNEQIAKLKNTIQEGCNIKQQSQDLNEAMTDLVKTVGKDMDIKPSVLKKAISVAFKNNWHDTVAEQDDLESILIATGRIQGSN